MPDFVGSLIGLGGEGTQLDPNKQVFRADGVTAAVAPRHGRLVVSAGSVAAGGDNVGKWFDLERATRWAVVRPESLHFGEALYRTAKGNWMMYTPGGDIIGPAVTEVTPEEAVAFLKREGYDIPASLRPTEIAQEV